MTDHVPQIPCIWAVWVGLTLIVLRVSKMTNGPKLVPSDWRQQVIMAVIIALVLAVPYVLSDVVMKLIPTLSFWQVIIFGAVIGAIVSWGSWVVLNGEAVPVAETASASVNLGDVFNAPKSSEKGDIILSQIIALFRQPGAKITLGEAVIEFGPLSNNGGEIVQTLRLTGKEFGIWSKAAGDSVPAGSAPNSTMGINASIGGGPDIQWAPRFGNPGAIIVYFPIKKGTHFTLTARKWTVSLSIEDIAVDSLKLKLEIRVPTEDELKHVSR